MKRIAILTANGLEEVEALTPADILRRAGFCVDLISLDGTHTVTSSHHVTFTADRLIEDMDLDAYDAVILPGGMPGTLVLRDDKRVSQIIRTFAKDGRLVAAICAAPTVLGHSGLLKKKKATCYPGMEDGLTGAEVLTDQQVVIDGNIITSRGLGTAIPFALSIVEYFSDKKTADELAQKIVYTR